MGFWGKPRVGDVNLRIPRCMAPCANWSKCVQSFVIVNRWCLCPSRGSTNLGDLKVVDRFFMITLQGTNISHLGNRKIILKSAWGKGYVSAQECSILELLINFKYLLDKMCLHLVSNFGLVSHLVFVL